MANDIPAMLSGQMFGTTNAPLSRREQLSRALMGFGAGLQGRGPEVIESFRAQDRALSAERLQAMAVDAMQVDNLLRSGRSEDALKLIDNRIQQINRLGGDPSDTQGVRDMIAAGNTTGALDRIGGFLSQANQLGIIKLPEQQTQKFGLSPLTLRDAQGNYIPAQLSEAGGVVPAQLPQGMQYVPNAGIMGFDPSMIAQRGAAETGVQVARTQQLAAPQAQAAGMTTAAQQAAQIEAIPLRVAAETQAERTAGQPQAASAQARETQQYNLVSDTINRVREATSPWTTGLIGTSLSNIPGTAARDLQANLTTIKANIGFDRLQQMRNDSPTGGALGSVTAPEIQRLEATYANLEQSQSPRQFIENLNILQQQLDETINGSRRRFEATYGQQPQGAAPTASGGTRVGRFIIEEVP